MKPTLEQLQELTDYEINCAVVEKLGNYALLHENMDEKESFKLKRDHGKAAIFVELKDKTNEYTSPWEKRNYCDDPRDYMEIAKKYNINIGWSIDRDRKNVIAQHDPSMHEQSERVKVILPKKQTGRAICIAYLMMEEA